MELSLIMKIPDQARKESGQSRLRYEPHLEGRDSYPIDLKVVVVLVREGENKDKAWRRHVRDNPEDRTADIKIFHFDIEGAPNRAALAKVGEAERRTGR